MKKLRLYIDTSVLGGIFDTEEQKRIDTAERLLQLIDDGTYEGYRLMELQTYGQYISA